jgi:uncharacterized protein (TIGR03067 family)
MTTIDGTYRCLSAVIDGKPLDASVAGQLQLTLDGELYRTSKGPQTLFEGRFAVNHETFPWRIDITAIEGPHATQTAQGLIQAKDQLLTICHTMPGQARPSELASHAGSGAQLVVWERMKEVVADRSA